MKFSKPQWYRWAQIKSRGEMTLKKLGFHEIAVPAAELKPNVRPPGSLGPEDFYDHRHNHDGHLWDDCGDLEAAANLLRQLPAWTGGDISDEHEAREWASKDRERQMTLFVHRRVPPC